MRANMIGLLIILFLLVISFLTGWMTNRHFTKIDLERQAASIKQTQLETAAFRQQILSDLHSQLEDHEKKYRQSLTKVTELSARPIYKVDCLDQEGVDLINQLRASR